MAVTSTCKSHFHIGSKRNMNKCWRIKNKYYVCSKKKIKCELMSKTHLNLTFSSLYYQSRNMFFLTWRVWYNGKMTILELKKSSKLKVFFEPPNSYLSWTGALSPHSRFLLEIVIFYGKNRSMLIKLSCLYDMIAIS